MPTTQELLRELPIAVAELKGYVVDGIREYKFVAWNKRAVETMHFTSEDIIGKKLEETVERFDNVPLCYFTKQEMAESGMFGKGATARLLNSSHCDHVTKSSLHWVTPHFVVVHLDVEMICHEEEDGGLSVVICLQPHKDPRFGQLNEQLLQRELDEIMDLSGGVFLETMLRIVCDFLDFDCGFVAVKVAAKSAAEYAASWNEPQKQKGNIVQIIRFYHKRGLKDIEMLMVGSECDLGEERMTVAICDHFEKFFPENFFVKNVKPTPNCYYCVSVNDYNGDESLGYIGIMNRAEDYYLDSLIERSRILKVLKQVKKRAGAEINRINTERELSFAKQLAEMANESKSRFLANMSHEIRTPMNTVIALTELILDTPLSQKQLEYIETIRMSGAHLMAIINDVLDLTKIESNSMVLTKETVDIRKAVQSVASICKHGLKGGKDVQFNLNISDRVPQYIMVDVTRLKQIFMNFLSNAYKFTNKGTITLNVDARSSDQHPEKEAWKEEGAPFYLYIEVEDTGIGMDKEKLSDLFKPFSQLDNSSTRQFTGSGLGLAISFHLARMMNGKVWVEKTEMGVGSTFAALIESQAVLDVEEDYESHRRASSGGSVGRGLWNPNLSQSFNYSIAVVEDNVLNLRLIIAMLQKLGYAADGFKSGHDIIQHLHDALRNPVPKFYDIIFCDLMMPDIDGIETTKTILKVVDECLQVGVAIKVPAIICLTANAEIEIRTRCLNAGMIDFLTKPVTIKDLQTALMNA